MKIETKVNLILIIIQTYEIKRMILKLKLLIDFVYESQIKHLYRVIVQYSEPSCIIQLNLFQLTTKAVFAVILLWEKLRKVK